MPEQLKFLLLHGGGNLQKMKTPVYYRHKPHEIERAFLVYVPEAPRISPDSVTDWEALTDETNNDGSVAGDVSRSSSKLGKVSFGLHLATNLAN